MHRMVRRPLVWRCSPRSIQTGEGSIPKYAIVAGGGRYVPIDTPKRIDIV
jgi:hypothetical protein